MKHKIMVLISILFLTSSCKNYYQIFETESSNTEEINNQYIFENDSIKITYDFWSNKGSMAFTIFNKLNKPLYIDWKKSSIITNSVKLNYWEDQEKRTTIEKKNEVAVYNSFLIDSSSKTVSKSISTKMERVTFIPPNSHILKSDFHLLPIKQLKISNYNKVELPLVVNKNKHSPALEKVYDVNDTPLLFRNFISYSYEESFINEHYIDNTFYIKRVLKVEEKQFEEKIKDDSKIGKFYKKDENGKVLTINLLRKKTSFYIAIIPDYN